MIRRFLSQPTMKFFGQANTDHPTPRAFHQDKASDDGSNGDPDNQASNGSNGMVMATLHRSYDHICNHDLTMVTARMSDTDLGSRIDACHGADDGDAEFGSPTD